MFLFIREFVYSLQKLNFKKANVKNDCLTLTAAIVKFLHMLAELPFYKLFSWEPDAVCQYVKVAQIM